jgi:hypothetical protein
MQSANGEPGGQRQDKAVATKADSALTPMVGTSMVDGSTTGTFMVDGSTTGPPPGPAGAVAAPGEAIEVIQLPPLRRRSPVVSRADLFGAISLASLVSLVGLPLGWLWSRLAPAQLSIVQEDLSLAALPTESQHRFDDLATFVLLGAMAGLLVGTAVWLARGRRGPLAVVGLAVGSLFAAWLAIRMGISFAHSRYVLLPNALTPDDLVAVAPRLDSNWVIVIQPMFAVLAYGIAAAANGQEDLGRRLT